MVAYSFMRRFEPAIVSLVKCQTIRNERRRHARPGEALQLYTAMRTKHCRLIGRAVCNHVRPLRIDRSEAVVELLDTHAVIADPAELDAFAAADGFGDWPDMVAFWKAEHPLSPVFSGVLITWRAFAPAASETAQPARE